MTAHQRNGAAASYRDHISKKKSGDPVFKLKVPSGFEWQVRKPNLLPYIVAGELPLELVAEVAKSLSGGNDFDPKKETATPEEQQKMLVFMREVVLETAVSPRITEKPDGPEDIHPRFVEWEDFLAIFTWGVAQGGEVDGLKNFRPEQAKNANARTSSKRRRKPSKRAS